MKTYPPIRRSRARAIALLLVSALFFVAAQFSHTTHAAGPFTVNSLADTPDAAPGNGICADAGGACTLRAALNEADAVFGEDTINFSVTGTINLTGPLPFMSSVTINGPGSNLLTVRRDTGGDYRIFTVGLVFNSISGLTISNGRTPDGIGDAPPGGGILHSSGLLRLRDVVITGNATGNGGNSNTLFGGWGGYGGGIFSSGTLEMMDCVISNNTTGNGGNGTQISGSGGRGGGIYLEPGILTMTNVTITNNHTGTGGAGGPTGSGGGMWIGGDFLPGQTTSATLTNVTVTNNTTADNVSPGADSGGGAGIFILQGSVILVNGNVSGNHTGNVHPNSVSGMSGRGGGINNNGTLIVLNSLVS